mmetsp:Transcript_95153/g.239770  ORF Transcript_95153/g.239770 Transcript_95153/m.239770 type:complete len:711 (-) Transcript_95153:199-2331(-)
MALPLLLLLPQLALGGRLRFVAPDAQVSAAALVENQAHEAVADSNDPQNFRFMTTESEYPGHEGGIDEFLKKQVRQRAVGSIKDEIVEGHFCAKRGQREQTYYASSLCYWVPELVPETDATDERSNGTVKQEQQLVGMPSGSISWQRPGTAPQNLCQGWKGSAGKCLKCSVCHNNARTKDGSIEGSSFAEEVPLPPCLKEKDIERQCLESYEASSTTLRIEKDRCEELRARRSKAEDAVNNCQHKLQSSSSRLEHESLGELQRAEDSVASSQERLEAEKQHERSSEVHMEAECHDYNVASGRVAHIDFIKNAEWLRCQQHQWTACVDGDVACQQKIRTEMDLYAKCTRCFVAAGMRDDARKRIRDAEDLLRAGENKVESARKEVQATRDEVQRWQLQLPALQDALRAQEAEWLSQEEGCQQAMLDYDNGKHEHVKLCAPTLYDQSCEKACLSQLDAGCGVIEGSVQGEQLGNAGGVQIGCSPPQQSWILAPEDQSSQCERITAVQKPVSAQAVLFAGWLWQQTWGPSASWKRRYFVLESGDAVRSARLRSFKEDPTESGNAQEQLDDAITLWDAVGIAKVAGKYLKREDSSCFLFYHFYRTFRFCAPDNAELAGGFFSSSAALRDHWVALLKSTFKFKGVVKGSPFEGVSRCCCTSSDPASCALLSGVELYKSKSPFNSGGVCPSDQGYRYFKKQGIDRLPPACLLPKFM